MFWKTLAEERMQRKWPSWSAHFAWGALITMGAQLQTHLGWAVLGSIIIGAAWEIMYAVMSDPKIPANRASVVDLAVWVVGSLAGAVVLIFGTP